MDRLGLVVKVLNLGELGLGLARLSWLWLALFSLDEIRSGCPSWWESAMERRIKLPG